MRLHYAPNSCALAVHIALEEAGADYELVRINFANKEQRSPEFLAMNPLGRVPILETEHGRLTEVPAILTYISLAFPQAGLWSQDPFLVARQAAFQAFLSSTVHVTFAHFFRPERWADTDDVRQAISQKAVDSYADNFRLLDEYWLDGPWVMGERFTTADPYLYLFTRWLDRIGLDRTVFPRIEQHFLGMSKREPVIRALQQEGLST